MSTGEPPIHGPPFAGYQAEIFLRGMAGEAPEHPVSFAEPERRVAEIADPRAAAYVLGGAGSEQTMRSNLEAFRRWRLVPRMLRDVSDRDLSVTVAGTRMSAPMALAPIGVQSIVHADGELALGADAALLGRPYVWGLAVGGEQGVLGVLRSVLAELDLTIGLTGHTRPDELDTDVLVSER